MIYIYVDQIGTRYYKKYMSFIGYDMFDRYFLPYYEISKVLRLIYIFYIHALELKFINNNDCQSSKCLAKYL